MSKNYCELCRREVSPDAEESINPPRKDILLTAINLTCGDRNKAYGSPVDNMRNTASLMTTYIKGKYGVKISLTPEDAAIFLVMVKLARLCSPAHTPDNYIDAAAYVAMAGECREDALRSEENRKQ